MSSDGRLVAGLSPQHARVAMILPDNLSGEVEFCFTELDDIGSGITYSCLTILFYPCVDPPNQKYPSPIISALTKKNNQKVNNNHKTENKWSREMIAHRPKPLCPSWMHVGANCILLQIRRIDHHFHLPSPTDFLRLWTKVPAGLKTITC